MYDFKDKNKKSCIKLVTSLGGNSENIDCGAYLLSG